jgi:hypothetical protein
MNPFRFWYIWVLLKKITDMLLEQENTYISELEIKFNEIAFHHNRHQIFENDFKYLKNTFENFLNLERISITYSVFYDRVHTVTIHQKTFKGLINLKYLKINSHHLRAVENGTFDGLISLKELHLTSENRGSNLNLIKDSLFGDLVNLEILNLSYNQIGSIEENTFKNLINLKELDLSYNQIGSIEENTFKNLINLKELDLNNNSIITIHTNAFQNLNKTNLIKLESNPVFENWVVPKRYLLRYLIRLFTKLEILSIFKLKIFSILSITFYLICLVGFNISFLNYFGFFDIIMLFYEGFSLFTLGIIYENHFKKITYYRSNFCNQNYLHRLFIFYCMEPFKNRLFLHCFLMYITLVILNSYLNFFYLTFIYWSFISNIVFLSFFYDIKFFRLYFIYPFTEFEIDDYLTNFFYLNASISFCYLIIVFIFNLLNNINFFKAIFQFYYAYLAGSTLISITFSRI